MIGHGVFKIYTDFSSEGLVCQPWTDFYLSSNANSSFIQHLDTVLVAVAKLSQNAALRYLDVVQVDRTGAGGSDAQFVFLLPH